MTERSCCGLLARSALRNSCCVVSDQQPDSNRGSQWRRVEICSSASVRTAAVSFLLMSDEIEKMRCNGSKFDVNHVNAHRTAPETKMTLSEK